MPDACHGKARPTTTPDAKKQPRQVSKIRDFSAEERRNANTALALSVL
jgi:hypothetical protein